MFEKYSISSNLINKHGNTLLSLSIQSNCFQITNYLLNSVADPNISSVRFLFFLFFQKKGNYPLHYALIYHNFEIADMLIKRGADENIKNVKGFNP